MKPVDQTTFGVGEGNCFSACIASLLHLPIEDVPTFMKEEDHGKAILDWLRPRGFYVIAFLWSDEWPGPDGFYIMGLRMNGGGEHAVVARGNEIVHDPNPNRLAIRGDYEARLDVTILVPIDPSAFHTPIGDRP